MSETKETKLPEMKKVASETIDVSKYVGKKSTIENIDFKTGNFGSYLKLESEVLGTEQIGKETKEIRASMLFSLKNTDEGLAIPEKGDLAKFMNNKKVDDYRDLKGCSIVILSKADEKSNDWLIFN